MSTTTLLNIHVVTSNDNEHMMKLIPGEGADMSAIPTLLRGVNMIYGRHVATCEKGWGHQGMAELLLDKERNVPHHSLVGIVNITCKFRCGGPRKSTSESVSACRNSQGLDGEPMIVSMYT